ncbi:hypothetical protein B0T19DRAFT_417443 [Cercophora scortea]|uniref:Uncharacterized protein n=1 Tax=Cercophora scortea TaxID=314031 RepID=A0AAE0MHZ9_9PEZI|nr:hypothetical protein B0T19DRAFT_417443 [Cercophora scortea]
MGGIKKGCPRASKRIFLLYVFDIFVSLGVCLHFAFAHAWAASWSFFLLCFVSHIGKTLFYLFSLVSSFFFSLPCPSAPMTVLRDC